MRRALAPLCALAALGAAACGQDSPIAEARPEASVSAPAEVVETQRVSLGTLQGRISASGSIAARRVTPIASEIEGRLVHVFVNVGDSVEEGDRLFQIDNSPYELALAEARATLELARAENANAIQEAERVEKLAKSRAVSQQRRDQLLTAAAVARARVAQAAARVARTQRDLTLTLILAPYAGSIVERLAHEGAMTDSGPIVVLQESSTLEAILDIPEASPAPVRVGDVVRLHAEGLAEPLESRVDRVNPRIDAQTRTYEVHAPVVDPSGTVKAGSYVRAEIALVPAEPRPLVDRSALLMRDGRRYVFRVVGDTVERRPVRIGVMDARSVQILSGVEDGDEVVRGDAVEWLTDGARVRSAQTRIGAVSGRPAAETLP